MVSPWLRPRPIIFRRRLIAWPSERLLANQRTSDLDREHDRAEDADEDERADPGRVHASNFASGRNSSADRLIPCAIT